MATSLMNIAKGNFFTISPEGNGSKIIIPTTTKDGSDTLTLASNWSQQNVQGGTQSLVAYNYVENPSMNINLTFNADLCREFQGQCSSYENIINNIGKIVYPAESSGKIVPPYCRINWDGKTYRGYFTNVRITLTGPYKATKNGRQSYRSECEVTGQFIVSPKTSIRRSNININGSIT